MRQLIPEVSDVHPARAYGGADRPAPDERPWVALGMIASLDGATADGATADGATAGVGTSGPLGGPADKEIFRAVRGMADVVLVGAGTVRSERYRPVAIDDEVRASRAERGCSTDPPRLAIVTASLDLDLDGPLFNRPVGAGPAPIVFTIADADPSRMRTVGRVSEIRPIGTGQVDLARALRSLADDGAGVVVCEGGPTLNGHLANAGLIDEVCVTTAPVTAGGASGRIVSGARPAITDYTLASLLTGDGYLFARWIRANAASGALTPMPAVGEG